MTAPAAQSKTIPPVRKEIVVRASPAHVFRVFTERINDWWPADYRLGKVPSIRLVLEPRLNGRWYEVGEDGVERNWGKVLVWEPPRRLVLAQQMDSNWQYNPSLIMEVEVIFTPHGTHATHVQLEHRNLERFGAAADGIRTNLESPYGWMRMLTGLAKVAES